MQKALLTLVFSVVSLQLMAQVFPRENSALNYRIIGFSFPPGDGNKGYRIEIAAGRYNTEDSFNKNIILSPVTKTNRLIAEVPAFGGNYTWRVVYNHKKEGVDKSVFYHFSTNKKTPVDTAQRRLNILHPAETHKSDYVSVDGTGVIYDIAGNPVWYIPDSVAMANGVGDVKVTQQGTITYLMDIADYEIDYNGKRLWSTPISNRDTGASYFHHEFTRLANGHYMALGTDFVWYNRVQKGDSSYFVTVRDTVKHDKYSGSQGSAFVDKPDAKNRGRYSTIIEFDEKGNVVWIWHSGAHLMETDYTNYLPGDISKRFEPHLNAFYFDEKKKVIYTSYRNLDRIIKIEYPSGKLLRSYGEVYKKGTPIKGNGVFCNQHGIRESKDGYIYFFNNNYCHGLSKMPSILLMKEPEKDTNVLETVWEYNCTAEGYKRGFYSGGNADELADGSFFICMGSDYAKLQIVNRDKKTLWSALPEMRSKDGKTWVPAEKIYRAHLVTRKDLEHLIWTAEKNG